MRYDLIKELINSRVIFPLRTECGTVNQSIYCLIPVKSMPLGSLKSRAGKKIVNDVLL